MPVTLQNQVVLIIGASSGIGRETAILFAREGAKVMAAARRQDRLLGLQKTLAAEGRPIEIEACDASVKADMEQLAQHTRARLGPIDVMVYVTRHEHARPLASAWRPDIWDRMLSVNLSGAYHATSAVLPAMRERKSGHLIFISSVSGLVCRMSRAPRIRPPNAG